MLGGGWLMFGRGNDDSDSSGSSVSRPDKNRAESVESGSGNGQKPESRLTPSTCPPELTNCEVASGRVIYVEAVDPDGDGDAHFVTTSAEGVSFPGITIFDVRKDLRPEPLPGIGDLVGGAGPVYRGSKGQKQIEVIEFHVGE